MVPPKKQRKRSGATIRNDVKPHRKPRGLPRPKSQPTYNIPQPSINLHDTDNPDHPTTQLARTKLLLDLVIRRNKNQHRTQSFWKWLSLLRRSTSHLLALHRQADTTVHDANKATTADATRKLFEAQADIRSQREVHEEWIREVLVPGCYVAFSSVVADKQFANLGVVLVGVLADVVGVVGVMKRVESVAGVKKGVGSMRGNGGLDEGRRITAASTLITGPDQGEVVERQYESDGQDVVMQASKWDHGSDEGVLVARKKEVVLDLRDESAMDMDSNAITYDAPSKRSSPPPSLPSESDSEPLHSVKETKHKSPTRSIPQHITSSSQSEKPSSISKPTSTTSESGTIQASSSKSPHLPPNTAGPTSTPTRLDAVSKLTAHKFTPSATAATSLGVTKLKKKKKKGNAIDDLFGGFA